jgi:hypothetical protein
MVRENASVGGAIRKSGPSAQVTNESVSDLRVSIWKKRQSHGFRMVNHELQIPRANYGQLTRIAPTQIALTMPAIVPERASRHFCMAVTLLARLGETW